MQVSLMGWSKIYARGKHCHKKNLFLIKSTCKLALGGIFIELVFQKINSSISKQPQRKQVLGEEAALPALQQNANMTGTATTLAHEHSWLTSYLPPVTSL